MKGRYVNWLIVLVVLLLVLVGVDVAARLSIDDGLCLVIPSRFTLEEPEWAEKLVRAVNVSGVKITHANTAYPESLRKSAVSYKQGEASLDGGLHSLRDEV